MATAVRESTFAPPTHEDEDDFRLAPFSSGSDTENPYRSPAARPQTPGDSTDFQRAKQFALERHQRLTGRKRRYFALLLLFLPLAWSTLQAHEDRKTLGDRLAEDLGKVATDGSAESQQMLKDLLVSKPNPETWTADDLFNVLPEHRIQGAFLPHDSHVHWAMAALSAIIFMTVILLVFPRGHTKVASLIGVAGFTGTVGIAMLLVFQEVAIRMPILIPRGGLVGMVIILVIDIIALIGQSYQLINGEYSFPITLLGFTCGVGLCEEVCKAVPAIYVAAKTGLRTWRAAMLWGLVSGVGFGVSEGVSYSHDFYNGMLGADIYWVRFISCVALHAIWAASSGIGIFQRQDEFHDPGEWTDFAKSVLKVVAVPMVLHGLYDALLTHNYHLLALGVGVLSFFWLAYQIETVGKYFDHRDASRFADR